MCRNRQNHTYTKASFDFNNLPFLTNPRHQLNLSAVGIGLIKLPAHEGYTFTHSHREQEEVYIVVSGCGLISIDRELVEIAQGDMIRVAPSVRRALKAGDMPLFVICAGGVASGYPQNPNARYLIDDGIPHYADIPVWYAGREDIAARNEKLRDRMLKSRAKRQLLD